MSSEATAFAEEFDAFLKSFGITHFTAEEVCRVGRKANGDGPALQPPPRSMWANIIPVLLCAEMLRTVVGPLVVTSGYRDTKYNAAVGGAANSQHLYFRALDLRPINATPAQLYTAAVSLPMAGWMGIGSYPAFVHIDTRGLRARW